MGLLAFTTFSSWLTVDIRKRRLKKEDNPTCLLGLGGEELLLQPLSKHDSNGEIASRGTDCVAQKTGGWSLRPIHGFWLSRGLETFLRHPPGQVAPP